MTNVLIWFALIFQSLSYTPQPMLLYTMVGGVPTPVAGSGSAGALAYTPQPFLAYCLSGGLSVPCTFSGGGGSGTVTAVSTSGFPSALGTASVTNPTTTPNLLFAPATAAQNFFLAGPLTGGAGAYTFRAIGAADLPLASASAFGAVKCGTGTTCTAGVISASGGTSTNFVIPRDANAHYEVASPGSNSFSTISFNNASGAGTYTAVGAPNTGTGYVSMQTTTTATINTATGIASLRDIFPINNPTFQAIFYLSATTNVNAWVGLCGFCNVSNATHTDLGSSGVSAAGFRYIAGTDTTWACYASGTASAAGTSAASGVAPITTTMQKFDVIYVAGVPTYYINNTRVCSGFAPTVLPDPTAIAGGQVVWDNTTAVAITGNIFDLYYGAN